MVADYNGAVAAEATYVNPVGPQSGNVDAGWTAIIEGSASCFAGVGGAGVSVSLLSSMVAAPVAIVALGAASVATYDACFTPAAVTLTSDERAAINDGLQSVGAAINSVLNHFGALAGSNSLHADTLPTTTLTDGTSAGVIQSAAQGALPISSRRPI